MNERIKELAEQAGMTNDKFGMYFAKDFDSHCADGVDLEKFAELIVKECMMLVEGFEITQEVALDEYVDYEASAVLKEHFGVEQ